MPDHHVSQHNLVAEGKSVKDAIDLAPGSGFEGHGGRSVEEKKQPSQYVARMNSSTRSGAVIKSTFAKRYNAGVKVNALCPRSI